MDTVLGPRGKNEELNSVATMRRRPSLLASYLDIGGSVWEASHGCSSSRPLYSKYLSVYWLSYLCTSVPVVTACGLITQKRGMRCAFSYMLLHFLFRFIPEDGRASVRCAIGTDLFRCCFPSSLHSLVASFGFGTRSALSESSLWLVHR